MVQDRPPNRARTPAGAEDEHLTWRGPAPTRTAMPAVAWARVCGAAAMLGGAMWTLMLALTAARPEESERGPGALMPLLFAAMLCFAGGAVGIQARQRRRVGRLGLVTLVLAVAGVAATVGGRVAVDTGVAPATVFAAGVAVLVLSFVLFGITTLAAGVLPRGAASLLVLGTLLLAVFNFGDTRIWLGVPFGMAWLRFVVGQRRTPNDPTQVASPRIRIDFCRPTTSATNTESS
jgi:FtsH-binding integral membrane protein